jgi:hypothetical protein
MVTSMSDYRRGLDWGLDLLDIYTFISLLQVLTAPSLNSTLYKSLTYLLTYGADPFLRHCQLCSILMNPTVYHRVHKSPPLVPT